MTGYELAAAGAMAMVLYLTWHRSRTPFALPAILIIGTLVAHLMFYLAGVSNSEAQALGWVFQPPPNVSFLLPWRTQEIARYPWGALPDLAGNLTAVIFVTASTTLFQHHRYRGRGRPRSRSRTRAEGDGHREFGVRRFRRLHRLHFDQPHRAQLLCRG
jgi:hypothetical protein